MKPAVYKTTIATVLFIVISSCADKRQDQVVNINTANAIIISVSPQKSDTIFLSEITDSIRLIKLETSEQSMLGDITDIEYDSGIFFCFDSNKQIFKSFYMDGRFHSIIGRKGRGPGEFFNPGSFAINRNNKEIWLHDNGKQMLKYDYSGRFLGSVDFPLFMETSVFLKDGVCCFTSKFSNFKDNKTDDFWGAELSIVKDNGNILRYIPINKELYPAGGGHYLIVEPTPFSELNDSYTFHFTVSDIIYSINKSNGEVEAKYAVDFGEYSYKNNIAEMEMVNMGQYIKEHQNRAGMVNNVIETEKYLFFTYYYYGGKHALLLNKENGKQKNGPFADDITSATFYFEGITTNNNLFATISNPAMIRLTEKAKLFLSEKEINDVNSSNYDDNPFILISYLK